jgi:pimeloyl-ACP methyl ester carboxylesterase
MGTAESDAVAGIDKAYEVRTDLRTLYPPIAPYQSGMLKVDDIHSVYYECSGNRQGWPVVYLHGGPGGGLDEKCNVCC